MPSFPSQSSGPGSVPWGLQGIPDAAASGMRTWRVARGGVLPARGDRRHPKKPLWKARNAWMATLCCWTVLPSPPPGEECPSASPPRLSPARRRAGDAAAARIINNRSLVKLFCRIYTLSRRTEGLAGAAAAPLDRSIHHRVQMAELQEVSSGAGPGCVSCPRPSAAGDSAGSEQRRLRDALGAAGAAAPIPQLSLPPPAATRGPG